MAQLLLLYAMLQCATNYCYIFSCLSSGQVWARNQDTNRGRTGQDSGRKGLLYFFTNQDLDLDGFQDKLGKSGRLVVLKVGKDTGLIAIVDFELVFPYKNLYKVSGIPKFRSVEGAE